MNSDKDKGQAGPSKSKTGKDSDAGKAAEPEWAGGLRELYDSVVDEPLPDSFKDLLAKLDGDK